METELHGKYQLTQAQVILLQQKEMCIDGIPVEVLARANLFQNTPPPG